MSFSVDYIKKFQQDKTQTYVVFRRLYVKFNVET